MSAALLSSRRRRRALLTRKRGGFAGQVQRLFGSSLIGYWKMDETSGTVAYDSSPQGNNGVYVDASLDNYALPSSIGGKAPLFNGTSAYVNIQSAGLSSNFSGESGTFSIPLKVLNAGVWTDSTQHQIFSVYVNGSNQISVYKTTTDNTIYATLIGSGTGKTAVVTTSITDWFLLTFTWSVANDNISIYINDVAGTPNSGFGTLSGSPIVSTIGRGGSNYWSGYMAHSIIATKALTQPEVSQLASFF